ncbi:MAG: hypothetical protein P0Y49_09785 [Candidatus Pedobacter colombiensis]|uniref:Uncharacterized protein n=1 Tax=Candidatus Pedobacter colombiensis TaxID=3121371 RepID=A0AAJ5W9U5_9SPHI|nr:hypothetical protein [Pedobacter sp.]WEK21428.1 MAG: hypothetical protein P0Y49_09785 [Pedobacter sp.]
MKKYRALAIGFSFLLLACSCKKKVSDSPGFPPSGQYFSVVESRQSAVNNKQLIIKKIDPDGNLLISKPVTEIITISEENIFRIASSWNEIQKLFNEGDNTFLFDYGNNVVDTIVINSTINFENNTIVFNSVEYNKSVIQPVLRNKPAQNSKIYQLK